MELRKQSKLLATFILYACHIIEAVLVHIGVEILTEYPVRTMCIG